MASIFGAGEGATGQREVGEAILKQQKNVLISTGILGFDESLGSGLPSGNVYLISGSLGSSSNQFVQQILYNAVISKRKVSYYTVENSSTDIIEDMNVLGFNIQQYVDEGSWTFARVIPPSLKNIVDVLPDVPMEQRVYLDESFTKLMNHFHDAVKEGSNTVIHLPLLVRNYPLGEIQNLLFYMIGTARRYGGIHFLLLTEGAHEQSVMLTIKDSVDSVFEISASVRGTELENALTISKIRGVLPKTRIIRIVQREDGLATETIRRIQ